MYLAPSYDIRVLSRNAGGIDHSFAKECIKGALSRASGKVAKSYVGVLMWVILSVSFSLLLGAYRDKGAEFLKISPDGGSIIRAAVIPKRHPLLLTAIHPFQPPPIQEMWWIIYPCTIGSNIQFFLLWKTISNIGSKWSPLALPA